MFSTGISCGFCCTATGLFLLPRPVGELRAEGAFPITLSLVIGAAIIWIVIGVLSGVLSAVKSRSLATAPSPGWPCSSTRCPRSCSGCCCCWCFITSHHPRIHAFPASYIPFGESPTGWFRSLILPGSPSRWCPAATYTRLTRGSMLDVMNEDYIRTARAKGCRSAGSSSGIRSGRRDPDVTQFGLDVGILLGGAVITEVVFSMPGLGYTAVQSIDQQDLPVSLASLIIASAAVVVANIVVTRSTPPRPPRPPALAG